MRHTSVALVLIIILSILSPNLIYDASVSAEPLPPDPLQTLEEQTGGGLTVKYHSETGMVRFIGADREHPIQQDLSGVANLTAETPAMTFLETYGSLFGIQDPGNELALMSTEAGQSKHTYVRYQQVYQGIPVMGAEIIVHSVIGGAVLSASGEFLPDIAVSTEPAISADEALATAIAYTAKHYSYEAANLVASQPELWLYNPAIIGGPQLQRTSLVWRLEVSATELAPIRELVLVDAQAGMVLLNFNQVDTAMSLATYDAGNGTVLPGSLQCDQTDLNCTGGDSHAVAAHKNAADTYTFYSTILGRDSIDNAGMTIKSTVHYDSDFANAYWSGTQMVYGDAYGFPLADDVVAHELTHGVTDYESRLFYYYQSGAINEALSDIFGELVDQWNGRGTDTTDVRWLLGEDVSGLGAMRSMSDPTLFNDPDAMTSSIYYCDIGDNGGVHYNSGVANKTAYLMVDGGTFNGQTITGIGWEKAAHIWYDVQRYYLGSASDYQDLATYLPAACSSLIGQYSISSTDCDQVEKAVTAVEMNIQPPACQTPVADFCSNGPIKEILFTDDLENTSSGNWSLITGQGTNYWAYPQNPNVLTDNGWDMTYATSGIYNIYGYDQEEIADYSIVMSNNFSLPKDEMIYFRFNHAFDFESLIDYGYYDPLAFDGGRVEYSVNNGPWTDAGAMISSGQRYNYVVSPDYRNPLAGTTVFSGTSRGYVSTRVNITGLGGKNVRFRFRIGTDSNMNDYGWYIDDILIYTCEHTDTYLPVIRK